MMSLVARAVGAVVFGMATATLAVAGAWAPLDDHPTVAGLLGAVVALGTAGPFLARTFSERTRLLTLSAQELARHFTDRIRETLVTSGAGLTLEDVGVHFFLKRRRRLVFWRHEYIRYARSAKPSRPPAPRHAMWREDWRTGRADGLVGIAAERRERLRVDLMDEDHRVADERTWTDWYRARDFRSLGVDWAGGVDPRRWFSTVWAEPVPASDGSVVGVITLNVEREVSDGHLQLMTAEAPRLLQEVARDAGMALHAVHL
jgi:hypothetical protein